MAIHVKGPTYDGTDPASDDSKRVDDLNFVLERASTADQGKIPFLNSSGYLTPSIRGTQSVTIPVYAPTTATAASATIARAMYLVPAYLDGFVVTSARGTIYDNTTGGAKGGGSTTVLIKKAVAGTAGLDAPTPGTWVEVTNGAGIAIPYTAYSAARSHEHSNCQQNCCNR